MSSKRKCKTENCNVDISERHILTKYCRECSIKRNKMSAKDKKNERTKEKTLTD